MALCDTAQLHDFLQPPVDERRYAEPAAAPALDGLLRFVFSGPSAVALPDRNRLVYGARAAALLSESRRAAAAEGERSGLILVHAFDQRQKAFVVYARALERAASPLLTNASLLVATSNAALLRHGQQEPGRWLDPFARCRCGCAW